MRPGPGAANGLSAVIVDVRDVRVPRPGRPGLRAWPRGASRRPAALPRLTRPATRPRPRRTPGRGGRRPGGGRRTMAARGGDDGPSRTTTASQRPPGEGDARRTSRNCPSWPPGHVSGTHGATPRCCVSPLSPRPRLAWSPARGLIPCASGPPATRQAARNQARCLETAWYRRLTPLGPGVGPGAAHRPPWCGGVAVG